VKSLIVLVDRGTASAAEILAAAVRAGAGATLVGERTAGKGIGQKALLLADGSGLSLTRLRLEGPDGTTWQGTGLVPDLEVGPIPTTDDGPGSADLALDRARRLILERKGSGTGPTRPTPPR
jgi:carboxyl-terminal processing protease